MVSVLSRRLGKRSLLGAPVHTPNPSGDGMLIPGLIQAFRLDSGNGNTSYTVSFEDGRFMEYSEDNIIGPGFQSVTHFKLQPGQKVYLTHGGREYPGVVEQHNHVDNEVRVYVRELDLRSLRRAEDVRLGESRRSPRLQELEREHTKASPSAPSSQTIDVPPRASGAIDMDEIMAAMVLSSLSCSPRLNPLLSSLAPASADSGIDGGNGSSSDCRSSNSSSPSPPPLHQALAPGQGDDGLDFHIPHPLLPEEPAPRKRKNSLKLLYRCMWPHCQKCLSSTVGIRRHIRTIHLGRSDSEHSDGEEDFYYTEIVEDAETVSEGPSGQHCTPPLTPPQCQQLAVSPQPLNSPDVLPDALVRSTPLLSRSAPSCLRQVYVDHTYQVSPEHTRTFTFASLSSQPQVAVFQPHIIFASTPQIFHGGKKVRGEAKKCRKVYGVENRSQWCTACRWKKACQRFHD